MGKPGRGKLFFPLPLARSHVLSCLASLGVNGELASRLMLEVRDASESMATRSLSSEGNLTFYCISGKRL